MKKNIHQIFKKLKGEIIQKFSVKEDAADQYFHLVTDKTDLKFGANDLGVWIENYKKIKGLKRGILKNKKIDALKYPRKMRQGWKRKI